MSIRDNITLASLRSVSTLGFLSRPKEERQAAALIQQLNIVARSSEQLVATLSGGNQQKCVLGKWLVSDRVDVMREGGVVSELEAGPNLTQERVVASMV